MVGNSRPASGAEHHISHLIEMAPAGLHISSEALHGEKVGVGTLLVAGEYQRMTRNSTRSTAWTGIWLQPVICWPRSWLTHILTGSFAHIQTSSVTLHLLVQALQSPKNKAVMAALKCFPDIWALSFVLPDTFMHGWFELQRHNLFLVHVVYV